MVQGRFIVLGLVLAGAMSSAAFAEPVEIETHSTHTRISFAQTSKKRPVIKLTKTGFEVLIADSKFTDWGILFGDEAEFASQVSQLADDRVENLKIKETPQGIVLSGNWHFPTGLDAPADPTMEAFDFVRGTPARFVVDFWQKKGMTVKQARELAAKQREADNIKKAEADAKKRADRRIAREKERARFERIDGFCAEPISEKNTVIVQFHPVVDPIDFGKWFPKLTPDDRYAYKKPAEKDETDEAAHVRLAHKTYESGQFALAVKVVEFFKKDYPKSVYNDDLLILRTSALTKLGLVVEADELLRTFSAQNRDSPAILQALLYLAQKNAKSQAPIAGFELFSKLYHRYPESENAWVFRLGVAESLAEMKQSERAEKEFDWLKANAPTQQIRADAAFRKGDIYLSRGEYDRAIALYFKAAKEFPKEAENSVSYTLNSGEALYWAGQLDESVKRFTHADTRFAANRNTWRALIRMAEVHGRKTDEKSRAESIRLYTEALNRYPVSIGSQIARMMLLPCGEHSGLSWEGAMRFFETIKITPEYDREIMARQFEKLFHLQELRTAVTIGPSDEAFEVAKVQLKRKQEKGQREWVMQTVGVLFRRLILSDLEEKNVINAIDFFDENSDELLATLKKQRGNHEYLLGVASMAADFGLVRSAERIYADYSKSFRPSDRVPSSEDLDLRIEASEDSIVEAKVAWLKSGVKAKEKIEAALNKITDESKFSYDREIVAGLLAEKTGRIITALKHASKAELLMPARLKGTSGSFSEEHARILYWQAALHQRAGNSSQAVSIWESLVPYYAENRAATRRTLASLTPAVVLGVGALPSEENFKFDLADALSSAGRWAEAAQLYSQFMVSESKADRAKFGYSRAMLEQTHGPDRKKYSTILEEVASSAKDSFWKKIASEYLESLRLKRNAKEGNS